MVAIKIQVRSISFLVVILVCDNLCKTDITHFAMLFGPCEFVSSDERRVRKRKSSSRSSRSNTTGISSETCGGPMDGECSNSDRSHHSCKSGDSSNSSGSVEYGLSSSCSDAIETNVSSNKDGNEGYQLDDQHISRDHKRLKSIHDHV